MRTYADSLPAFCQPLGRLIPGIGQARHTTANSPGAVPSAPVGSCPLPARLSIFEWRHSRRIIINAGNLSYGGEQDQLYDK